MRVPYALDDGTHYTCDCDGCVPFVFTKKDAEYASKVINKVVNDFSNNRGLPPDERIVKAIDEPEASPEENKGFEYSQIQTASKADDGKKMPEQDIFEPEPEQTQFVGQDFER